MRQDDLESAARARHLAQERLSAVVAGIEKGQADLEAALHRWIALRMQTMPDDREALIALMDELSLTIGDLSQASGLSRHTVAAWKRTGEVNAANIATIRATLHRLAVNAGLPIPELDTRQNLEVIIFNVLGDHTSDLHYIDEVGAKLIDALLKSGLLKP